MWWSTVLSAFSCGALVLAVGHSARDTFAMLHERGVALAAKPFAIGAQDRAPPGLAGPESSTVQWAGHPSLWGPPITVSRTTGETDAEAPIRSACVRGERWWPPPAKPGGVLTKRHELSRPERTLTPIRALLVQVGPGDFPSDHPLAGIEYQRIWERRAYEMGGGYLPCPGPAGGGFSRKSSPSAKAGDIAPSYRPGVMYGPIYGPACRRIYVGGWRRRSHGLMGNCRDSQTRTRYSPGWRPAHPLRSASSVGRTAGR